MSVDPQPRTDEVREFRIEAADNRRLAELCGPFDQHLRQLEDGLQVEIANRGGNFRVSGPKARVAATGRIIQSLYLATADQALSAADIHLYLQKSGVEAIDDSPQRLAAGHGPAAEIRIRRGKIRARGANQALYVQAVRVHDICFGIGPAGTGKTYLAVAAAVEALESERIRRLVLVRPAVEAGERLGFLPGDLAQKIDPYLRPLYDALYEMLGFERVGRLIERNVIEIAPLAYMRGRTLNEAFIILDEAQNTSVEQMKMFLTRIGFGSSAVITGDLTQIDLPRGQTSGLLHARDVLGGVAEISFTYFTSKDVVRHRLVARILDAYEAYEAAHTAGHG